MPYDVESGHNVRFGPAVRLPRGVPLRRRIVPGTLELLYACAAALRGYAVRSRPGADD